METESVVAEIENIENLKNPQYLEKLQIREELIQELFKEAYKSNFLRSTEDYLKLPLPENYKKKPVTAEPVTTNEFKQQ